MARQPCVSQWSRDAISTVGSLAKADEFKQEPDCKIDYSYRPKHDQKIREKLHLNLSSHVLPLIVNADAALRATWGGCNAKAQITMNGRNSSSTEIS
jgi:hypothetical protein